MSSFAAEDLDLAGKDVRRRDEEAHVLAGAHALEIDQVGDRVAQRVDVERVRLVGAPGARDDIAPDLVRPVAEDAVEQAALQRRERTVEADTTPERFELRPRGVGPAFEPAFDEDDAVHGAGARSGDRLDGEAAVLEQRVEHAPGEGAVGAAALQARGRSFFSAFGPTRPRSGPFVRRARPLMPPSSRRRSTGSRR